MIDLKKSLSPKLSSDVKNESNDPGLSSHVHMRFRHFLDTSNKKRTWHYC